MANAIGTITFIIVLASILTNNLIYLKKVRELLKYLRDKHPEKIRDWGLPDSLMDVSPKRGSKFLQFLKSPDYFSDITLKKLKEKVSIHLKLGYILFGGGIALVIIIYIIIGVTNLK